MNEPIRPPREHAKSFAAETRALTLARTRLGIAMAIAFMVLALPVDALLCQTFYGALAVRATGCLLLLGLYAFAGREGAADAAFRITLATGTVIGLTITALAFLAQSGTDEYYVLQQLALLVLAIGVGDLLPLPAAEIALLVAVPVVLQLALTIYADAESLVILFFTGIGAVIALVIGDSAFQLRRREFDQRAHNEALLRARADFVAMLSHDMKNCLGAVVGLVEIVRDDPPDGAEERNGLLDNVESSARRALELAVNFVIASQIESDALDLHREPVSLNAIIESLLVAGRTLARRRKVTIETRLDPDLPDLALDRPQFERVVENLLSNAVKFSAKGATVRITTARHGGDVALAVADQGPGIAPAERPRLFERYSQAAGGARKDSSGLGLFIVKTIVEAHGGSVSIDCPPQGGSVFEVRLPASGAPAAVTTKEPRRATGV
jgi:signal transduction histidine kinase